MDTKEAYMEDIIKPILMPHVEIIKDMHKYARMFPTDMIPHTSENGIVDTIHNYKRPKLKEDADGKINFNVLDARTPVLTEEDIQMV
jgi:hypothetical protein